MDDVVRRLFSQSIISIRNFICFVWSLARKSCIKCTEFSCQVQIILFFKDCWRRYTILRLEILMLTKDLIGMRSSSYAVVFMHDDEALQIELQTICRHLINENYPGICRKKNWERGTEREGERSMPVITISDHSKHPNRKHSLHTPNSIFESVIRKKAEIVSFAFFVCYFFFLRSIFFPIHLYLFVNRFIKKRPQDKWIERLIWLPNRWFHAAHEMRSQGVTKTMQMPW